MSEPKPSNPPLTTHRDGAVFVKVWKNEHENGPSFNATIGRIYTDKKTGEIHESRSLGSDDILKGQKLLGKAYDSIALERTVLRTYEELDRNRGLETQRDAALGHTKKPRTPTPDRVRTRNRQPEQ